MAQSASKALNKIDRYRWDPLGNLLWWIEGVGPILEIRVEMANLSDDFGKVIQGPPKMGGIVRFDRAGNVLELVTGESRIVRTYETDLPLEEYAYEPGGNIRGRIIFRYDSLRRRVEEESYTTQGEITGRRIYTYGDSGSIQEIRYSSGGHKCITDYDEHGQVVASTSYRPDGSTLFGMHNRYDSSGRLAETETTGYSRNVYLYDASGRLVESRESWSRQGMKLGSSVIPLFARALRALLRKLGMSDQEEEVRSQITFSYDHYGNIAEKSWYESHSECIGEEWLRRRQLEDRETYRYEQDGHGNWIKRIKSKWDDTAQRCRPVEVAYRSITYIRD